jgi:hypothetical protein
MSDEQSECNWKLDSVLVIQEIRELINCFSILESIHIMRNANKVADRHANMSVNVPTGAQVVHAEWTCITRQQRNSLNLINHCDLVSPQQNIMHLIKLGRHHKETKCTTEDSSIL